MPIGYRPYVQDPGLIVWTVNEIATEPKEIIPFSRKSPRSEAFGSACKDCVVFFRPHSGKLKSCWQLFEAHSRWPSPGRRFSITSCGVSVVGRSGRCRRISGTSSSCPPTHVRPRCPAAGWCRVGESVVTIGRVAHTSQALSGCN
jgi:hypothetical protein